ncbi:MAG: hypothetical protein AAFO76_09510 [Cyanobacteria bacterium J06607_15]
MPSSISHPTTTQQLTCPQLPLAVYREVAAHLRQVEGINTSLILRSLEHDPKAKFDYYQSQVAALQIDYGADTSESERHRVSKILAYYAQRYADWVIVNN